MTYCKFSIQCVAEEVWTLVSIWQSYVIKLMSNFLDTWRIIRINNINIGKARSVVTTIAMESKVTAVVSRVSYGLSMQYMYRAFVCSA